MMRSKLVFAALAGAVIGSMLIARGCSARNDGAAPKAEMADDAVAGAESQSAEFSLSAKDSEGFDLPEREEIRQKRKLVPGTKVFVIGPNNAKLDTDGKDVIVMGINGPVKVETADTDIAEVLVVRSARKREDLQSQKVEISDYKGLYIHVGSALEPDPGHEFREKLARVGRRLPESSSSPSIDSAPEIRRRVILRLPRKAGLDISEIGGDVAIEGVDRRLEIRNVIGKVRAARVAGLIVVGDVNGAVNLAFAPGAAISVKIAGVNGDVDLGFNGEVNADLQSWGIVGAIKPDFPNVGDTVPVEGGLKARIGAGGSLIEINDVNGNLTLSKAANRDGETERRRDRATER
jgi:hypothetical protein